jgi:ubiquinone/menaquinone biosynthesis C-methylase UbiE
MYSGGAREYERHADRSLYNARYERPAMLSAIGDVTGLRIIDAGCAAGYYAATLGTSAQSVVALDVSPEMIRIVNEKRLPNVEAHVHDLAEPLTWIDDATIDLVVSSLAMHYLASWKATLREFHRVLVLGGRLVMSTHHPAMTDPIVEDYFEVQLVHDTWTIEGKTREITFYHRPMSLIVNELIEAHFDVRRLIEPKLESQQNDEERKLATRPWFLILEARKS